MCFGRVGAGEVTGAVTVEVVVVLGAVWTGRGASGARALLVVVLFFGTGGPDVARESRGADCVDDDFKAGGRGSRLSSSCTEAAGSGTPIVFGRPFTVLPESLTTESTATGFMRNPSNIP